MGLGYHVANLVEENNSREDSLIVKSLQHLALVATMDKQTIAQLVAANAKSTNNIGKLTDKLVQVLQTVATLTNLTEITTPTNIKGIQGTLVTKAKSDLLMDPIGYCLTHGYKVKHGHNSTTYTRKKPGHHDNATRIDIMGGSMANKKWIHPHCIIASATSNNNNDINNESNFYLNP